jgi:hypothetical protein
MPWGIRLLVILKINFRFLSTMTSAPKHLKSGRDENW